MTLSTAQPACWGGEQHKTRRLLAFPRLSKIRRVRWALEPACEVRMKRREGQRGVQHAGPPKECFPSRKTACDPEAPPGTGSKQMSDSLNAYNGILARRLNVDARTLSGSRGGAGLAEWPFGGPGRR